MGSRWTAHKSIEAGQALGMFHSDAGFYSLAVSCFAKKDRRVHTSIPMCAYTYVKPEMDQGGGVVIIF
jgi:hypothetical protein